MAMLDNAKLVAFVPTRDAARAKAFYGGTLGLRLVSEDAFALVYEAGGTVLRVTTVPTLTPHPFTVLGWTVPDLAATVTTLSAHGIEFERVPGLIQDAHGIWTAPGGAHVAWFKDRDGNLLSLTQGAV
jgi:catechol 2,3-dioxygenase-like lactoylglutathione lyase family enzyme